MNLRLPVQLKENIEDAAAENKRTLTAEVVARLQQSFADPIRTPLRNPNASQLETLAIKINALISKTNQVEVASKKIDILIKNFQQGTDLDDI